MVEKIVRVKKSREHVRDTRNTRGQFASKYRRLLRPIATLCRDIWHAAISFVSL